jgi:hypothetical protein
MKKPGSIYKRVRPGLVKLSFSLVTRNLHHPTPIWISEKKFVSFGFHLHRSLTLATALLLPILQFYISGISICTIGMIPIPIYTYNILPLRLSVVYMCVSFSFYISIVYTLFFYTTTILYTITLSYISYSFFFTLPF